MALLGYILPLEEVAADKGAAVVEVIKQSHGTSCLHFLKLHGEEDIEHIKEAIALAGSLGDNDRKLINQNIEQMIYTYSSWLKDIAQQLST